ncbi:hypothetical protein E2C01_090374 [Portunus trituberculatus]|uniref:Uncharacterized protein n=1 Tax=Portunus trituberculatus TaxID=210409 RepID=A0A5B7JKQ6_PORTR|nr:hypothetical protein [Portunus trituberculatus]
MRVQINRKHEGIHGNPTLHNLHNPNQHTSQPANQPSQHRLPKHFTKLLDDYLVTRQTASRPTPVDLGAASEERREGKTLLLSALLARTQSLHQRHAHAITTPKPALPRSPQALPPPSLHFTTPIPRRTT